MKIPFWATILMMIGVVVLCGLGSWQVKRLVWKQEILSKLDAAYEQEQRRVLPIDFKFLKDGDFAYGKVVGTFRPSKAILLGPRVKDKKMGADLIVPLETSRGSVLVNLGWTDREKDALPIHHLEGHKITVVGLARSYSWNSFTPDNIPEQDLWYKPDIREIAVAKELESVVRFFVVAETASNTFRGVFPNNERWYPKNDHLQYAWFWFAMAVVLIGVYVLRFVRKGKNS